MLTKIDNPVLDALAELMELGRRTHTNEDAWLYALTWLVACRLTIADDNFGDPPVFKLASRERWNLPCYDEIPNEAKNLIWGLGSDSPGEATTRLKAIGTISKLLDSVDSRNWDLIDAPWHLSGTAFAGNMSGPALAPELCDVIFDAFSGRNGNTIWIPFDATGQLVLRAVRKGLRVIVAGPGRRPTLLIKLLLAIESQNMSRAAEVEFDAPLVDSKRDVSANFLIAIPPFAMRIQTGMGWHQWEGTDESQTGPNSLYEHRRDTALVRLDRSDSWSVAALWPRITDRAVFLVSPNVLFAKGQEQKLREYLVLNSNALDVVVSLPNRQLGNTGISCAMLIMSRRRIGQFVNFIDASEMTSDAKSSMKFSRLMDRQSVSSLIAGDTADAKVAVNAGIAEIANQDFNLVPARYLRPRLSDTGVPRRKLGELVAVIRAPALAKEAFTIPLDEAGFPELDKWKKISGPFLKTTNINPKKVDNSILQTNDILLSIKGTLGKTALIGDVPSTDPYLFRAENKFQEGLPVFGDGRRPVVPSQSCIALRIRDQLVRPEFLFLYLRSDEFKQQIDVLRVGTSVAHVTPATLLQEISVPVPTLEEQNAYGHHYSELCRLEAVIDDAKQRIDEIRSALWPTETLDTEIHD